MLAVFLISVINVDAKKAKWNFEIEALLNSATGNSRYKQYKSEVRAVRRKGKESEINLKVGYNNQRTKGKALVDCLNLEMDAVSKQGKNSFYFMDVALFRERVRQFRLRSEGHTGVGYTNGRKKHRYEIRAGEGVDYRLDLNGNITAFTESIVSVEYSHLFPSSRKTKFSTKGRIEIRNDTPGDYTMVGEASIKTSMTRNVFVKVGTEVKYDNLVPAGVDKTDTLTGISLIYKF
jgi:putative salt-induced outer membrane protein YdiY